MALREVVVADGLVFSQRPVSGPWLVAWLGLEDLRSPDTVRLEKVEEPWGAWQVKLGA